MKLRECKSLGLTYKVSVPETAKEFDDLAKRPNACVEEAVNNVIYRSVNTEFRDLLIHGQEAEPAKDGKPAVPAIKGLEDVTKIERKEKPSGKKKEDGTPIMVYAESEQEYMDRVLAGREPSVFQSVADEVAKHLRFDPSATERKPAGPKKLPDMYLNTAKQVIAGGNQAKLLAMIKRDLGKDVVLAGDADKDAVVLGWAIKEHKAWRDKDDLQKNYVNLKK